MKRSLSLVILVPLVLSMALIACRNSQEEKATKKSDDKVETTRVENLPSFAGLVEKLKPSVVNISTTSVVRAKGFFNFPSPFGEEDPFEEFFKRFFGEIPQQEFRQHGLGSGFIISGDGYVVTNNHVIDKAQDIEVILANSEKYKAKVVGKDPKTDLALLKIEPKRKLQAVTFGDSDKLQIGDWVIAIGNPFGLGHTVTAGIVSAKGRVLGLGNYDDFIQTDAPINPGNSGGPLFNLQGQVVGVNTAIVEGGQGIGFAIPINMAKDVVEQLKEKGRVIRGWLGVMIQNITPEIAEGMGIKETKGALVADVTPGGPAEKVGIKRGDIIVEFNGHRVEKVVDLTSMVAVTLPGTEVQVKVIREGKERDITVKIGELTEKASIGGEKESKERIGLTVEEITPQIANQFNLGEEKGVVVTDVEAGGIADEAGFQVGDVILEIGRQPIKNIDDYERAVEKLEKGKSVLFLVKRGKNTIYIGVKIG
ncbi:MAG: peptidase [Candidatus Dadabacteria bacterium]